MAIALAILPYTVKSIIGGDFWDVIAGPGIILGLVPVYLLGKTTDYRRFVVVVAGAGLIESLLILLINIPNPGPWGVIFDLGHYSGFVICLGIVLSSGWWRTSLIMVGIPAIIVSGTEEGLLYIAVLAVIAIYNRRWRLLHAGAVLVFSVLVVVIGTGYFADTHDTNGDRLASVDNLTHDRYSRDIDAIHWDIITGTGWNSYAGPDSVHNTPLRIAGQFGILVAIVWLGLMITRLRGPLAGAFLLILSGAMIDNYFWHILLPIPIFLLGLSDHIQPLRLNIRLRICQFYEYAATVLACRLSTKPQPR